MRDLTNETIVQKSKDGVNYIQFKKLLDLGIKHAYALKGEHLHIERNGGNVEARLNSFKHLCNAVNLDAKNITKPNQTHTDNIQTVNRVCKSEELIHTDGVLTNKKDIILTTTNADCILYLIYDPKNKVIGNVHSGWRGSYQRIMEKTIDKMIETYGSKPEDIIICICPSIRKCCFEVDKDVRDMFYDEFSHLKDIDKFILNGYIENKYYIDTVGINNELFLNKGIKKENIIDSGICSVCNNDLIHSYRSEKEEFMLSAAIISL